jgi:hypothetical protein
MDLQNQTPFPAGLFRTRLTDGRIAAAVLARITYRIENGLLVADREQPWLVSPAPWASAYGPMDGDDVFYKGGVDLFVFGQARSAGGRPAPTIEVVIEVGCFRRRLIVFGNRVWQKKWHELVPSAPEPIQTLSLALANAFGGKSTWDGLDVPFTANPVGKGFYLEDAQAVGRPLPNIEDPDHLIKHWNDRPDPAGVTPCPPDNAMHLQNGLEFTNQGYLQKLRPTFFNAAFPRMIAPRVEFGTRVKLEGVLASGPLQFTLPQTGPSVRLHIGNEVIERPLAIDQVGIEVDKGRAFLAYRYPFRYVIYPLQERWCELFLQESAAPRAPQGAKA